MIQLDSDEKDHCSVVEVNILLLIETIKPVLLFATLKN